MDMGVLLVIGGSFVVIGLLIKSLDDNQKIMERKTRAFEDMALAMSKIVSILEEDMKEE
jgi:hypothetical protein